MRRKQQKTWTERLKKWMTVYQTEERKEVKENERNDKQKAKTEGNYLNNRTEKIIMKASDIKLRHKKANI